MKDLAAGAWFGACILLIRNADSLPLWADITITAAGVLGITCAVIWGRVSYDAATIDQAKSLRFAPTPNRKGKA